MEKPSNYFIVRCFLIIESIENISLDVTGKDKWGVENFIYDYNHIVTGKGKVRLYATDNPTQDTKDIEFSFRIPVRELGLLNFYGLDLECD